jgi:hypothetical protein
MESLEHLRDTVFIHHQVSDFLQHPYIPLASLICQFSMRLSQKSPLAFVNGMQLLKTPAAGGAAMSLLISGTSNLL